ncbi:Nif3-like dinuclear metal center hexameric protein [Haloimpatiens sp. FM7315]|uniref:Nif3-like dinuclear metal center hexameric protein n=1 Tax=Haloimpatiens sp. FM7315 TaxID=3298609 RepID=UPI00370CDF23
MELRVSDIDEIMKNYAPERFKESYDNVGLMVGDLEDKVTNILIALDCTLDVIKEAKEKKCNLVLTHHPLLFLKPSSITKQTLVGKKVIELIENHINVYSSHTNLDSVKHGLNDNLMDILGFKDYETIEPCKGRCDLDLVTGVGRIVTLKDSISIKNLCNKVKMSLHTPFLRYSGDEDKLVKRIAVINGSGEDFFEKSKDLGAECIITGDTTYHYVSDFLEQGVATIDVGHFETEWPSFKIFGQWLESELRHRGCINEIVISSSAKRVYKFK